MNQKRNRGIFPFSHISRVWHGKEKNKRTGAFRCGNRRKSFAQCVSRTPHGTGRRPCMRKLTDAAFFPPANLRQAVPWKFSDAHTIFFRWDSGAKWHAALFPSGRPKHQTAHWNLKRPPDIQSAPGTKNTHAAPAAAPNRARKANRDPCPRTPHGTPTPDCRTSTPSPFSPSTTVADTFQ